MADLPTRLATNIRQLREGRGFTQQQMARLAELPRATWANLESGAGNPTLNVLHRVASALQVSIEELISAPRAVCQLYRKAALPVRRQGMGEIRKLLPDSLAGMEIDRMELPPGARMPGVPHTPGTREYLTCESGELTVLVAGERFELQTGDVVVFQGDQRHSYLNPGTRPAIGYSVVVLVSGSPAPRFKVPEAQSS